MSADNWAVCPKCRKRLEDERDAAKEEARAAYGKVPAEEWRALVAKAEEKVEFEEHLREDFGIGTTEAGVFYIVYRCICNTCGFTHTFKHEEQLT